MRYLSGFSRRINDHRGHGLQHEFLKDPPRLNITERGGLRSVSGEASGSGHDGTHGETIPEISAWRYGSAQHCKSANAC